jgi:hypothetical protein
MFFTKEFQRNPLSSILGDKDATYWTSFELALMTPWFVILLKQPEWDGESPVADDAIFVYRTIVTGDVRDALGLISSQHQSEIKVHSVSLVFPNRDGENASWEMKKITAAWTSDKDAPDNELISATVDYVETDDGQLYPMLHQPKAPKTKEGYRMMCSFPNGDVAKAQ